MSQNNDLEPDQSILFLISPDYMKVHKPKPNQNKPDRNNRIGSKTAPSDIQVICYCKLKFDPEQEGEDYIGSYTYYVYYNSLRPRDPRLPRPTYKPSPDLDYIRKRIPKKQEKHG